MSKEEEGGQEKKHAAWRVLGILREVVRAATSILRMSPADSKSREAGAGEPFATMLSTGATV